MNSLLITLIISLAASHANGACLCGNSGPIERNYGNGFMGRYPWEVYVRAHDSKDKIGTSALDSELCNAKIISDFHVIVSSSCVKGKFLELRQTGKSMTAKRIMKPMGSAGFAVVQLSDRIEFNEKFMPICLSGFNDNNDLKFGENWDATEANDYQEWTKILGFPVNQANHFIIKDSPVQASQGTILMTQRNGLRYLHAITNRDDFWNSPNAKGKNMKSTVFDRIPVFKKFFEIVLKGSNYCPSSDHLLRN